MSAPFVFGKIASLDNFTDRTVERETLVRNFRSLINTIIISPRRWGKSSLVNRVAETIQQQGTDVKVCRIDLFNVRSEEHFYELLAQSVLRATSSRWEESVEAVKRFFTRLVPKVVLMGDMQNEISLDFDLKELKSNPDEVLDLAERIATEKGVKIVICIDEFQNISEFDNSLYIQKRLRSHWQQHQHVSYCLYGSKRHMMVDIFTNSSMPFYKFGELMFLDKIATPDWLEFIAERFQSTGKRIAQEQARQIVALADNHPYYVQQLAQQAWLRTETICTAEIVATAHEAIIGQLSLLFVGITETLTRVQLNFLRALLANETALSSMAVIENYGLGNSSNVNRARKMLIDKDIIDDAGGKLYMQDPMYAFWLKNIYFA